MTRVIWAVLLLGQIIFVGITAWFISNQSNPPADSNVVKMLTILTCVMLVTNTFMGVFIRSQIYKKNWQGQVVTPQGYFSGNLIMLASMEGVVLLGLVVCILAGSFWPAAVPTALAMAIYAVNFPHGGPMHGQAEPPSFPPMAKP